MTLLGATRSEISGGTPRDPLETRCGALQVLPGMFTEDFGCTFDADFVVQSFVTEFFVRILARIFQMGVRILGSNFWVRFFCRRRQTAEARIFKKLKPKIRTPFPTPGLGSGRGLGGGGDAGRSTAGSWLGAVEGNKATGLNCSLVPFHCLPCAVCLEFCTVSETRETEKKKNKTKTKKNNPQDQNPFREICKPKNRLEIDSL